MSALLESNQAYTSAMNILWKSRLAAWNEHNEIAHKIICDAQDHITKAQLQEFSTEEPCL
jgi:DNA-binding cell septation regulator SpoVG